MYKGLRLTMVPMPHTGQWHVSPSVMREGVSAARGEIRSAEGLELHVLLTVARLALGTSGDEEALALLRIPLNWTRLFELAAREGMGGLLAHQLHRLSHTYRLTLPLHLAAQALHGIFGCNGAFFAELATVCESLRRDGLQVILLKGGALIKTVYQGQLGLRPLSDLDLLVKASDLPVVTAILLQQGFRPSPPSSIFFTKDTTPFDLHTELNGAEWVARKTLAFRFDGEMLWREALPLEGRDTTLLGLSPPHQFMHLVVHGLKHAFTRLVWFVDLGLVLQHVTWKEVVDVAEASGALRPLAYALHALKQLLGVEAPAEVLARLPRLNWLERVFLRRVVRRHAMETPGELLVAFSIPGLRGKLAYLVELAFPRREALVQHYPATHPWLLYPHRLVRLMSLGWRDSRGLWRS